MYEDEFYGTDLPARKKSDFDRRYLEKNKYHKLLAIPHYNGIALDSNISTLWRFDVMIDMKRGSYQCNDEEAEFVEDVKDTIQPSINILKSVGIAIQAGIIPQKTLVGRFKCHKQKF